MIEYKNILLGVWHGLWDSIRGMTLILYIDDEIYTHNFKYNSKEISVPSTALLYRSDVNDERSLNSILKSNQKSEKKIAKQVLKCCLLNGGFTWLSMVLFEQIILPTIKMFISFLYGKDSDQFSLVWVYLDYVLSGIFSMMWVMPIFILSKIVSSLWFADIANAAYRIRKGRPQMISSLSKLIADFLFSILVQTLFLIQSMVIRSLPLMFVGECISLLHLCMLYSLYCFEYKWFNMGWELHRRLSYIEANWPYFLGFGIPLTALTSVSNSAIVSSCIFSIFFPLFILSGNEAKPVIGTTRNPLRIFSPVIYISNLFFNRSSGSQCGLSEQMDYVSQKQNRSETSSRNTLNNQSKTRSTSFYRYEQPPKFQNDTYSKINTSNNVHYDIPEKR